MMSHCRVHAVHAVHDLLLKQTELATTPQKRKTMALGVIQEKLMVELSFPVSQHEAEGGLLNTICLEGASTHRNQLDI